MLLKTKIPLSYVFGKIKWEVLFVFVYASLIALEDKLLHVMEVTLPLSVPMVLGTVLSLLLAFKSNQAYDRWWEARIAWGAIVNDSRSLIRQVLCFTEAPYGSEEAAEWVKRLTDRQIAWAYSVGMSLRKKMDIEKIRMFLTPDDIAFVGKHDNVPNALLQLHAQDLRFALREGWINAYQQVEMEGILTKLTDSMGRCERIKNTVFPATYTLYIHFCLFFFVLLLPFALLEVFGMLEVLMVVAISSAFFLIEKMAIHLQDPFESKPTDTPVTAIAQTIEGNLKQMVGEKRVVREPAPAESTFYVL
ncbi:bestrophin family protein [Hymenobacter mucosus]|uniref:Putative membrane protein n=1 Tax=Hymenobacter mucosus TaxID=1411120 RepID=A0A238ZEB6_9BACT|nr:bestrophin family ion channel [Hymenobacter mucosus]SNR81281.1 putative membrane protein [Hymenobacter mucosus]